MGVGFAWKPFRECPDSLVWSRGGLGDSLTKPAGPSAVHHPTSNSESGDTEDRQVTRRDPHRNSRCAPAQSRNLRRTSLTQSEKPGIRGGRKSCAVTIHVNCVEDWQPNTVPRQDTVIPTLIF